MARIMVAVVRPLRSNQTSEYFGPRIWKTGCAIAENNCKCLEPSSVRYFFSALGAKMVWYHLAKNYEGVCAVLG